MASRRNVQPDYGYASPISNGLLDSARSNGYSDASRAAFDKASYYPSSSGSYQNVSTASYSVPITAVSGASLMRSDPIYTPTGYNVGPSSAMYGAPGPGFNSYNSQASSFQGRISPEGYLDDYVPSPSPTDYPLEPTSRSAGKSKNEGKGNHTSQRRPSNRDEFDGPHQFLQRPPPEYIAQQERDLPHLPTNLVVQEQDSVLTRVNDRLSQCAFDFVAKYQFPIPINESLRPVERPQDREWTEWVYLLKRLATKRRIPARVLYNGQIKQFVTILENSLEMRHAAKHQSRPLKDDRNILQLISAGIQVAKILKDAAAMSYLDQLYVTTEKQIQERSMSSRPAFMQYSLQPEETNLGDQAQLSHNPESIWNKDSKAVRVLLGGFQTASKISRQMNQRNRQKYCHGFIQTSRCHSSKANPNQNGGLADLC
ncbi:hypothetical protein BP5796_09069 [Coleophoma crateriformis]|uniref:Uncharacterized protein n=1 Tax=Coleophoma crateriformis TaxID=565419 RepID=A0A3D8R2Y9_9HELO|nr:hypothetical protein BP5796_09069 [Coleophoma crateriformis]